MAMAMVGIIFNRGMKGLGIMTVVVRLDRMTFVIMLVIMARTLVAGPMVMGMGMLMQMGMVMNVAVFVTVFRPILMPVQVGVTVDMPMLVQMFMRMTALHEAFAYRIARIRLWTRINGIRP